MKHTWDYKPGDWWVYCDVCDKKIKASKSKHRWDGFLVCDSCFETRHPQDFVRTKNDKISVPFSRPPKDELFTNVTYTVSLSCTPMTSSGNAGIGTAGCARAGITIQGLL